MHNPLFYLVYATLDDLDDRHQTGMIDEEKISNDDCASPFDICEVAHRWVYGVEGVSCDIKDEIVKWESLNSNPKQIVYDFSL